jgi:excinuclease ABC subunit C
MFTFQSSQYPATPGCYLMRNARGKVIYVGKAKKLRNRLASYFQKGDHDWKTRALVRNIAEIEVILVNNEVESLVLENNLIKHYRPRYNRMLMRDDTGYKYIILTDETIPRLVPFKKHWINKDLGEASPDKRFGPYPNGNYRDRLLDYICDTYQLRTCNPIPKRVCLRYHLGICSGICESYITLDAYSNSVHDAVAFLRHPNFNVLRAMKHKMECCVDDLDFERAQRIKNQYDALKAALAMQIVERDVSINQDVIYFGSSSALVMSIKKGVVRELKLYLLNERHEKYVGYSTVFSNLYTAGCPDEIITNVKILDERIGEHLKRIRGKKVKITLPQRGIKRHLLALCRMNYDYRTRNLS